jgi:hypothetical protein
MSPSKTIRYFAQALFIFYINKKQVNLVVRTLIKCDFLRKFLLFISILVSFKASAQYHGGNDDGFANAISINQNPVNNIFKGGNDDGFGNAIALNQNTALNIFKGGNDDGMANAGALNQNTALNIFKGGNDDGFANAAALNQNAVLNIFKGGNDDGFANAAALNQNAVLNIFKGGVNDGIDANTVTTQNATPNIYKGGINDGTAMFDYSEAAVIFEFTGAGNWDVPANWKNNFIPPNPLPVGFQILINPTGNCILNVTQVLAPGSTLTVISGKNFIVPGNIQ